MVDGVYMHRRYASEGRRVTLTSAALSHHALQAFETLFCPLSPPLRVDASRMSVSLRTAARGADYTDTRHDRRRICALQLGT